MVMVMKVPEVVGKGIGDKERLNKSLRQLEYLRTALSGGCRDDKVPRVVPKNTGTTSNYLFTYCTVSLVAPGAVLKTINGLA